VRPDDRQIAVKAAFDDHPRAADVVRGGDDDDRIPAPLTRLFGDPAGLALGAVGIGREADRAAALAEAGGLDPPRVEAVRDRKRVRDPLGDQPLRFGQPVAAPAGEDDDDVRPARRRVRLGPDEQVSGRRGEGDEQDEEKLLQCAIARSTASSSSGERAVDGRPRSSSFM
jgi:hypothetical protein